MADEEDGEPQMSAECRVEALPLSGADISIDGLRLRLDIRIVPRSKGEPASAHDGAMFRVVTAKLSKASQMPAYQWAAVMVGVGTLLIALTVWIAGIGEKPSPLDRGTAAAIATPAASSTPNETKAAVVAPALPAASAPTSPTGTATDEQVAAGPATTPVPGALPSSPGAPTRAAPRIGHVAAEATLPPESPKRPEPPKRPVPRAERSVASAAAPSPPLPEPASQPVAQRPAARADMLDLFGDTK